MKSLFGKLKTVMRPSRSKEPPGSSATPSGLTSLLRKAAASGASAFEVEKTVGGKVDVECGRGLGAPTVSPAEGSGPTTLKPGHYTVGNTIAHGGMGNILVARDLNLRRSVAMKVILPEKQTSEQYALRFLQEAQLTAQLEHPNIVPVHELGHDEQGRPFYTMKFVKGVTLKQVLDGIREGDPEVLAVFSLAHLLTIFQKVCDAVAFAHSRGVVHRDLKPENIMLGDYGEVLVMDWGLAKLLRSQESEARMQENDSALSPQSSALDLTLAGQIVGTPHFMSPEQAEGKVEEIDARSDIFALGGILYNILTLQPPVTGSSVVEVVEKIRSGNILPPSLCSGTNLQRRKHAEVDRVSAAVLSHYSFGAVPESLSAVAMKAMALPKEYRYQTVPELQREIEAFQGGFATSAEQAGAARLLWLLIKRHKALFIVGHGALLVLAAIVAIAFLNIRAERNHALESERRAMDALRQLRATAPLSFAQAQALVEQERFEEALARISSAITLAPDNAEYHCLKGNILESLLRLKEAAAEYGTALECKRDHALAAQNKRLCEKIVSDNEGREKPMLSSLVELQIAIRQQGRLVESGSMIRRFGTDPTRALQLVRETLRKSGIPIWDLGQHPDGSIQVQLSPPVTDISSLQGLPLNVLISVGTDIRDLKPLRGMPLTFLSLLTNPQLADITPLKGMALEELELSQTSVCDIGVLRGMPLRSLGIGSTQVRDLSSLKDMPLTVLSLVNLPVRDIGVLRGARLQKLDLSGTAVSDLAPLAGMPIEWLEIAGTPVSDLTSLRGMPLRALRAQNCEKLHDLSPLADCKQLEKLVLPSQHGDIEFLRKHSGLKRIDYDLANWDTLKPAAEFWKEYDAKKASTK